MLNAYTQTQNRFAGINANCEVRHPMMQTTKLLMMERRSPVHDFRPTRIVAKTVRQHERQSKRNIAKPGFQLEVHRLDELVVASSTVSPYICIAKARSVPHATALCPLLSFFAIGLPSRDEGQTGDANLTQ
jgi:hypothetical protein